MIEVTEQAKQELKKILNTHVDLPEGRLRLMDRGQGKLGLGVDIEMPGDELVKCDGSTILVIERGLAANLKGVTLDVEDSVKGSELVISYK
jgi:Fe-S cluster assembly iron-binding protein IscA